MLGVFSSSGIDKKTNDNETSVRMVNYTDIIQSRKYNPIQTGEKEYMVVSTPVSKLNEHRLIKGDMVFIDEISRFDMMNQIDALADRSPAFKDLLKMMLYRSPIARITVDEILVHPFVTGKNGILTAGPI
jgi:serine/threonine protein kinase